MPADSEDIANRPARRPLSKDQSERYAVVREAGAELAMRIKSLTPASREQSLALEKLHQAIFWAYTAISWDENEPGR